MTEIAQAINIFSGSSVPLGAALTNPTTLSKRKGKIQQDYAVTIAGIIYADAEGAYQKLKKQYPQGCLSEDKSLHSNLDLLAHITAYKLLQHPRLFEVIGGMGGTVWLEQCTHYTNARTRTMQWWEGKGRISPMLCCLISGYEIVLEQRNLHLLEERHKESAKPVQLAIPQ